MGPPITLFWMSALGFKAGWMPFCMLSCLCDPQIHLWWDTCWLCRGQHGSQAFSIHLLADKSTNIGGGSGWGQTHDHLCSEHAVYHLATSARLIGGNPDVIMTLCHNNGPACCDFSQRRIFTIVLNYSLQKYQDTLSQTTSHPSIWRLSRL